MRAQSQLLAERHARLGVTALAMLCLTVLAVVLPRPCAAHTTAGSLLVRRSMSISTLSGAHTRLPLLAPGQETACLDGQAPCPVFWTTRAAIPIRPVLATSLSPQPGLSSWVDVEGGAHGARAASLVSLTAQAARYTPSAAVRRAVAQVFLL